MLPPFKGGSLLYNEEMNWKPPTSILQHQRRQRFVYACLLLCAVVLIVRLLYLQVYTGTFLKAQGDARMLRTVEIPSYRGLISDRRGVPLAVSTPVDSVWLNPQKFSATPEEIAQLATFVKMPVSDLIEKIKQYQNKQFMYLKRDITPDLSLKIKKLSLPGVHLKREFKRYYPAGIETGQLVGFTNIDDVGQAGVEMIFESTLKPTPGKIRVLEDRAGRWVQDIESIRVPDPGESIKLSIDLRIQALAFRALQEAVEKYQAKSATLVMLDVTTGEILALVSAPSFNPNKRSDRTGPDVRARAFTDQFEPGSTAKPFSTLSALESGRFSPTTLIETDPGYYRIGRNVVRDIHNNGTLSVEQALIKSSNIALSKMTLALPAEQLIQTFMQVGFGIEPLTPFPGERSGVMHEVPRNPFVLATLAFGYSFTVTPIQIAHAYAILANKGIAFPISLLKRDAPPTGKQVLSPKNSEAVFEMLTHVVSMGIRGARIPGYQTAGKSGTTRLVGPHGYDRHRHNSLFAGVTPVESPKLATVVIIEEPQGAYYGAAVAAPVYAKVVGGALHLLNIPPDDLPSALPAG